MGEIPPGMWVLHKCDNPPCVRPDHLFLGNAYANTHDSIQKGRHVDPPTLYGELNGLSKLTQHQVNVIKERCKGLPPRRKGRVAFKTALAREFGIDLSQVNNIIAERQWKEEPVNHENR